MNMNFQFNSLSDFILMAGHGPYVWVCYLVTAVALGYLLISPVMAKSQFLKSLARQERLAQAQPRASSSSNETEQKEST
ncbi:heme exporter protein CcmD [Halioxenophilus aromaticivorans]|uniref:heme exporter protein CcmD n=1 Tax=Halioxenophilus aromaticivorans TaxID=1306992 RepID=UPI0031ED1315